MSKNNERLKQLINKSVNVNVNDFDLMNVRPNDFQNSSNNFIRSSHKISNNISNSSDWNNTTDKIDHSAVKNSIENGIYNKLQLQQHNLVSNYVLKADDQNETSSNSKTQINTPYWGQDFSVLNKVKKSLQTPVAK